MNSSFTARVKPIITLPISIHSASQLDDIPVKNDTKFENGNTNKLTSSFSLWSYRDIIIASILEVVLLLLQCGCSGSLGSLGGRATVLVFLASVSMSVCIVMVLVMGVWSFSIFPNVEEGDWL
jgi:hypothetical protein